MDPLPDLTIAFFGEMTASMTHEIKNIFAVIQESSGLMADLFAIAPLPEDRLKERFSHSLDIIDRQIRRGMELTTCFNRLAHSPEQRSREIGLAETIAQIRTLSERFARNKQVEISCGAMADDVFLFIRPVVLHMALFYGIMCCLEILPAKSGITLTCRHHDDRPAAGFHCSGDLPPPAEFFANLQTSDRWNGLLNILENIEAAIVKDKESCGFSLIFDPGQTRLGSKKNTVL